MAGFVLTACSKNVPSYLHDVGRFILCCLLFNLEALPCVLVWPNLGVHFDVVATVVKTNGINIGQRDRLLRIHACCLIAAGHYED